MEAPARTHEDVFLALWADWTTVAEPPDWDATYAHLSGEWGAVAWQGGGQTLLAALGLQYLEVPLCRGLAWLLDPDGGHQLGRLLVDALLADLGLEVDESPVEIRVEESRTTTRADIVVRAGGHTVVVEAKVLAGEQPEQADRLWEEWEEDRPTLVFLTRTGHLPFTADKSSGRWKARTWGNVARLARTVADRPDVNASPGAREFIETIGVL